MTKHTDNEFVRVVIRNSEDRVLVVIHRNNRKKLWNFPGGKVEIGESPEKAARREIAEETGLKLGELFLFYEDFYKLNDNIWKGYFFLADSYYNSPQNMEPNKLHSVEFSDLHTAKRCGQKGFLSDVIELLECHTEEVEPSQMRFNFWST